MFLPFNLLFREKIIFINRIAESFMLRKNKTKSTFRLDFAYKFWTQCINFSQFRSQQGLKNNLFVDTRYLIHLSEMRLTNFDTRPDLQFTTSGVSSRNGRLFIRDSDGTRLPVYYVDGSARRGQAGSGVYAGRNECYSFRCTGPVRLISIFYL